MLLKMFNDCLYASFTLIGFLIILKKLGNLDNTDLSYGTALFGRIIKTPRNCEYRTLRETELLIDNYFQFSYSTIRLLTRIFDFLEDLSVCIPSIGFLH